MEAAGRYYGKDQADRERVARNVNWGPRPFSKKRIVLEAKSGSREHATTENCLISCLNDQAGSMSWLDELAIC